MNAYEKGKEHGRSGLGHTRTRAYESEKANNDYFRGVVDGTKIRCPGQMIVRCERDNTIFPAFPSERGGHETITCPTCYRGYIKVGDKYVSDRDLSIMFRPAKVTNEGDPNRPVERTG